MLIVEYTMLLMKLPKKTSNTPFVALSVASALVQRVQHSLKRTPNTYEQPQTLGVVTKQVDRGKKNS